MARLHFSSGSLHIRRLHLVLHRDRSDRRQATYLNFQFFLRVLLDWGQNEIGACKPTFCAGAALLLILANICLGCKYKWVACLLLRLEMKSESDCKDLLCFYYQEILVQPVLRQPLRAPHFCSPSQGPDASWPLKNILDTVLNLCGNRIEEPSKQKPPRFNHVWVSLNLKMI